MAAQLISDIHNPETTGSHSGDSREKLLADVMREMNAGLEQMPARGRAHAVAEIHAIAENVRKRQAQSSDR